MSTPTHPEIIRAGDVVFYYDLCYDSNEKVKAVKLYDEKDEYITEFFSKKDLMEFFDTHTDEEILKELGIIQSFRVRSKEWFANGGPNPFVQPRNLNIRRTEKMEVQEAFLKRINMLIGDMSSADLAKILDLQPSTVYNVISGNRFPTAYFLKRIADRCGVSVDWLIGRQ